MSIVLCKRCNENERVVGVRASGRPYRSSYCSACTAAIAKEYRERRDASDKCLMCGEPRESDQKRCNRCALELTLQVAVRYRANKKKATAYLGGECGKCRRVDDIEIYDFHHIDPVDKVNGIGDLLKLKWEKIVVELDKCILLCSPCHRKRERQIDLDRLRARCASLGVEFPPELAA